MMPRRLFLKRLSAGAVVAAVAPHLLPVNITNPWDSNEPLWYEPLTGLLKDRHGVFVYEEFQDCNGNLIPAPFKSAQDASEWAVSKYEWQRDHNRLPRRKGTAS